MRSSYLNKIDYSDIFATLLFNQPLTTDIVEIGVLDGYSLEAMANNVPISTNIKAYDIFEEFNGNSSNKKYLENKFSKYSNVSINYGDFYNLHSTIKDQSLDILHIDIANNGDVVEYIFANYMDKLKSNGILIMEGGSNERDNVEWMIEYNKPKINPVLKKYSSDYHIKTIGTIPSITIIRRN